jgi:hypothetical protein
MASMPIHHETEYLLTDDMQQYIIRDAQEHFGEQVRAIRVQTGLARQAFNARTREVRYAFSPMDFGVVDTTTPLPETSASAVDLPDLDDDLEDERLSALFDDVDTETAQRATSLESLEEEGDETEDEDVFTLDDPVEDADEDEDEDDSAFDTDDEEE